MQLRDPVSFFEANYMPEPNSGCWIWLRGLNKDGYGSMSLRSRAQTTHRFAWQLYRGPIQKGMCVCHRCDVRGCVNPDHLFLGTPKDNDADMRAKGRAILLRPRHGELNGRAKLRANDVVEIRRRKKSGENLRTLAKEYGVTQFTICKIASGARWGQR